MATVAGVKIKPKAKKITSVSIRENAKRDHSPNWDGASEMSTTEYAAHFRNAMKYYNLETSAKDLKVKVIDWMGRNDYSKDQIQTFKKTKDWRCHLTMGSIAANLIKGMPDVKEGFNDGKSTVAWLKNEIANVIETGKHDIEEVVAEKGAKTVAPVVNIQDRIREQAVAMSDEIDAAIDNWITDPEAFDPNAIKLVSLLRGKGAKAAQARYIKGFFAKGLAELQELASGAADEQLKEGYKFASRKNIKKLISFYEGIASACDQLAQEAKVLKKPRAKKAVPADKLVAKLKFLVRDDKLGIVSVPPAQIVGAQGVVLYNVRTRKLTYVISKSTAGIGVKGATLTDFTDKSVQKTLRNPQTSLKEFKEQNTQKRFETWFARNIKTTEIQFSGRMNEDTIILKVFK